MRILALTLTILMMLVSPAAAGTAQDPEMKDPCGFGTDGVNEPVLPWHDLCGVWFETGTSSGAPEIKIVMDLVDPTDRPDTIYWVEWTAGGCNFMVERHDGGNGITPGDPVATFSGSCPQEVPCPALPDVLVCTEASGRVQANVTAGYVETDSTIEWTLRFDGAMAAYADHHADGAVLEPMHAYTAAEIAGGWGATTPDHCDQSPDGEFTCTGAVTDRASGGRAYVVGS